MEEYLRVEAEEEATNLVLLQQLELGVMFRLHGEPKPEVGQPERLEEEEAHRYFPEEDRCCTIFPDRRISTLQHQILFQLPVLVKREARLLVLQHMDGDLSIVNL